MSVHEQEQGEALHLRGLYWTIVVLVVGVLLYCLTVALVRQSAQQRLHAEIERLRAAGEPITRSACFLPRPSADEDAMTLLRGLSQEELEAVNDLPQHSGSADWLAIARDSGPQASGCVQRLAAGGVSEREALKEACALRVVVSPRLDPDCRRWLLEACLEPHAVTLASCRQAGDRPRVSVTGTIIMPGDMLPVCASTRLLCLSALLAAERGNGAVARDDLGRALRLLHGVGEQSEQFLQELESTGLQDVVGTLEVLLESPAAPRELLDLEGPLAAYDPWALASRAIRRERAFHLDVLTGMGRASAWDALWQWPSESIRAADMLIGWRAVIELSELRPEIALQDPGLRVSTVSSRPLVSRSASREIGLRVMEKAGLQCNRLVLTRAALRARFEGVEAARAFLMTSVDVFTGTPPMLRIESDGTIVLWCSSSPTKHASESGPAADDLTWRVPDGR